MSVGQLTKVDHIPEEIVGMVKESVVNTFASIIDEQLTCVEDEEEGGPLNGIVGNITVFNSKQTLSLMFAIPKDTALHLSKVFIGMEIPFESDDMGDLIGEIANILAGDIAASVEKVGFRGQSSLPTATRGSNLTLFMPTKPPKEEMKFSSTNTEFWLTMVLSESK